MWHLIVYICILQVLLLLKARTKLHPTASLMLNLIVLDWSLTSPSACKTQMKPSHACHLALLQLAVMVSSLAIFAMLISYLTLKQGFH